MQIGNLFTAATVDLLRLLSTLSKTTPTTDDTMCHGSEDSIVGRSSTHVIHVPAAQSRLCLNDARQTVLFRSFGVSEQWPRVGKAAGMAGNMFYTTTDDPRQNSHHQRSDCSC